MKNLPSRPEILKLQRQRRLSVLRIKSRRETAPIQEQIFHIFHNVMIRRTCTLILRADPRAVLSLLKYRSPPPWTFNPDKTRKSSGQGGETGPDLTSSRTMTDIWLCNSGQGLGSGARDSLPAFVPDIFLLPSLASLGGGRDLHALPLSLTALSLPSSPGSVTAQRRAPLSRRLSRMSSC
ncbi:hypothetical protein SRHO_G00035620 [Serrasalmus rhombeus]